MPHQVVKLDEYAMVYDADDNAVCQTKGPDAEATANRIARALDAAPALLEIAEMASQADELGHVGAWLEDLARNARAAIAAARGELTA